MENSITSRENPRLVNENGELRYIIAFPAETETGEAISISESEIENLIKSKGAVFAAIQIVSRLCRTPL